MSSVFRAFEQFTLEQEQHERGSDLEVPPETLQTTIKVFILNTPNPQIRYQMMNFCLRIIASSSSRIAQKNGALLTLLSLPTAMMQNHIRIADRSPDSIIERIEIEGFEQGTYRLRPNARTPMTNGEITALEQMAEDLPEGIANDTPYINPNIEGDDCDEMEKFLNAIYSVLVQVWITVCKCMTAYDQPTGSDERRLAKYQQQGRLDQKYVLQNEIRRIIQKCIRDSLTVRQFLTFELQTARKQGPITSRYYAMVGDIGKYIENAGMSAFFMTTRFALGTKWPPLALAAFSGELIKLKSLMMLYRRLGERARFMALLEMQEMMEFAPANYPLTYSYAMGIGSVQDPQMRNYNFARTFLNAAYFQLGVETANRQQGSVDKGMAEELGLSEADKREMSATLTRLTTGRGAVGPAGNVDVLGRRPTTRLQQQDPAQFRVVEEDQEDDEDEDDDEGYVQPRALQLPPNPPARNDEWFRRMAEQEVQGRLVRTTADIHQIIPATPGNQEDENPLVDMDE
ncbi:nucleocapsid protein [Achimota virus 2]|uniref:Nucleocapsid n=1 Tax=Achimota virus 2 TaxID=1261101 RepID=K7XN69_9MONO|nr:nucleocapsid protein [Achimota virus 2]AFX75111.1 nucleocapsid protein [Achimota virus 2]